MTARLRVVVAGMVAGVANQGGAAWAVLQWALGAHRLGHDVVVLEELGPASASSPAALGDILGDLRLPLSWHAYRAGARTEPSDEREATGLIRNADLVINLAGTCRLRALDATRRSVFVDLDPAYTQAWHAEGIDLGIDRHSHHATVGLALGATRCKVPLLGRRWMHTLPPVDLPSWPADADPPRWMLTTVANWRSYGSVSIGGVICGQKAHALRPLATLPRRSAIPIELALAIDTRETGDIAMLQTNRWHLVDPGVHAGRASDYRHYVSSSAGEFGLAKQGYVASRCGWFSDRSACYLAAGRPTVIADTGAGDVLAHEGILRFSSLDEAVEAIEQLATSYDSHARGARHFAEAQLDATVVVGRLIEEVMS